MAFFIPSVESSSGIRIIIAELEYPVNTYTSIYAKAYERGTLKATNYAVISGNTSNQTLITFSGLKESTEYCFDVYGRRGANDWSIPNHPLYGYCVTTKAAIVYPPSDVTGLKVTDRSPTSISLSWDHSSGADGYYISRTGGNASYTVANYATFTGLNYNTSYTFYVQATNSGGSSGGANISATTLPNPNPPPAAPSITLSDKTTSSATLALYSAGATYYSMEYKLSTSSTWIVWSSYDYSPITVTGLTSGQTYHFRARAYNAGGYGNYSTTLTVSIGAVKPINWEWNFTNPNLFTLTNKVAVIVDATQWNKFTAKINEFRIFKLGAGNNYNFTPANTTMTNTSVTSCINQAAIAINDMVTNKLPINYSGVTITKDIFNTMATRLNSIL